MNDADQASASSTASATEDKRLLVIGMICAGVLIAVYALAWYAYLFVRTASIGYEGPLNWAAVELAAGRNIYPASALSSEPWITILYPPLYMLLAAVGAFFVGNSYLPARLISCLASVAAALFFFKTLRLQDCSRLVSITTVLFYFGLDLVLTKTSECRTDLLSLSFGALASYAFVAACRKHNESGPPPRIMILPAILCSLSFLAKQQGIVFIATIILTLLAERRYKATGAFAAVLAAFAVISLGSTQLITGGFFANLSLLSPVHSRSQVLITNIVSIGLDWGKVFVALCLAPLGILLNKKISGAERFPLMLFFISASIAYYTMGIPASNTNHLIPAMFGLCWWSGLALRKLPALVCLVPITVVMLGLWPTIQEQLVIIKIEPRVKQDIDKLKALKLNNKLVLTDDPHINLVTGSKPVFIDCATFMNLWKDTGKGYAELTERIAEHKYAAIIINEPDVRQGGGAAFWPPEVIASVKKHYKETDVLFCGPWILLLFLPAS